MGKRDRIFHGQLGAGTDGEMGSVSGIAEQNDILMVPGGVLDGDEVGPFRVIGQ
jgi:hypothetical protein